MSDNRPIGLFDSGVGGLSVLGAVRHVLPCEDIVYFGDTANAPYGTKKPEDVLRCVDNVMSRLFQHNVKAVVIACNTATAVAAASLRKQLSLPIIGMEPALKPAWENRRGGKILVMATPVTLSLDKFHLLMEKYGDGAEPVQCPGLMDLVEKLDFDGAEKYLREVIGKFDISQVDSVVLGCTHYVFLRDIIRKMLPDSVGIYDGNMGTARQLERVLQNRDLLCSCNQGKIRLLTSGNPDSILPIMNALMEKAVKMFETAN